MSFTLWWELLEQMKAFLSMWWIFNPQNQVSVILKDNEFCNYTASLVYQYI